MTSAHPVESPVGRTIIEVEEIPVNKSTVVFCWAPISHSRFDILCIYCIYSLFHLYFFTCLRGGAGINLQHTKQLYSWASFDTCVTL